MADVDVVLRTDTSEAKRSLDAFTKSASANIEKLEVSFSGLKTVVAGTFAFLAARGVVGFLENAIHQAQEGQDAINELNSSLIASGQFTEEASKNFQDFAEQIQKTTRFSDEQVLSTGALIQTLGQLSAKELPKATKAALDLSIATGKSLTVAAQAVARAAEGSTTALSKFGIQFRKGKTDAETFANALAAVNARVGGRAEADVRTFSGAIARLSNQFADAVKKIGTFIIESSAMADAVNTASSAVDNLSGFVVTGIKYLSEHAAVIKSVARQIAILAASLAVVAAVNALTAAVGSLSVAFGILRGFIQKATVELAIYRAGSQSLSATLKALGVTATITKAALTFGASLLLDVAINQILTLKDEFGSLGNAATAAGIKIQIAFLTAFSKIDTFVNDVLSRTKTGVIINSLFPKIGQTFTKSAAEATAQVSDLQKQLNNLRVNPEAERGVAGLKNDLFESRRGVEDLEKAFDDLAKSLKNTGKTQIDILVQEREERLKLINETVKKIPSLEREAQQLRRNVILDFEEKIAKEATAIQQRALEARKKQTEEIRSQLEAIGGFLSPLKSLATGADRAKVTNDAAINAEQKLRDERIDAIKKASEAQEKAIKAAAKAGSITDEERDARLETIQIARDAEIKSITDASEVRQSKLKEEADAREAQLAKEQKLREAGNQLVAKGLGAIAEKFIPGLGSIVSEVLGILSQGPEAVREAFKGLVSGIQLALQGIADSIEPFILGVAEAAPALVNKLVELAPLIIAKLVELAPQIIAEQVKRAPEIIRAQLQALLEGFTSIVNGVVKATLDVLLFIPRLVISALQSIPVVGELFKGVQLAKGGEVPQGFPNDSFAASLSSGETVVPRGTTDQLKSFLDRQQNDGVTRDDIRSLKQSIDSGSEKNLQVNLKIGEKEIAAVLLQINRQGFRTAI